MRPGPLGRAVLASYDPREFPALWALIEAGERDRPLTGVRVLSGFPVWTNVLPQMWAMQSAGADLVVSPDPRVPHDPEVVAELPELGVPVVKPERQGRPFDVVLDCAGIHADVSSTYGYVELTQSGVEPYRRCPQPVFLVDAGRIKLIENSLGTGDGFVRAMAAAGFADLRDRSIVIIGGGKVGRGIAHRVQQSGAIATIVDSVSGSDSTFGWIDREDRSAVRASLVDAWCVVTATGVPEAMSEYATELNEGDALLANMGVADEFGERVAEGRVLNAKKPLNFALPEPTRLRYIDPSLALAIAGIVEVRSGRLAAGLNAPDPLLEDRILRPVRDHGFVAAELAAADL